MTVMGLNFQALQPITEEVLSLVPHVTIRLLLNYFRKMIDTAICSKFFPHSQPLTDDDIQQVTDLLGRPPRGLVSILIRCELGVPVVIQVASLIDAKPFPTLIWLVDKKINYEIDQLEAAGVIAQYQTAVNESQELQTNLVQDHQNYIDLRKQLMPPEDRAELESLGYMETLDKRGIGGIENFTRIRCLHTFYAAHLIQPNTIGTMVEAQWQSLGISFTHFS
jgi:hypothetical protein